MEFALGLSITIISLAVSVAVCALAALVVHWTIKAIKEDD